MLLLQASLPLLLLKSDRIVDDAFLSNVWSKGATRELLLFELKLAFTDGLNASLFA